MIVRPALASDLEHVLAVADRRRRQYVAYQPQFWKPAPNAVDKQRDYFRSLLGDSEKLFLVAVADDQVQGFVIATAAPAPPVYEPGGLTCLVDDFTVDDQLVVVTAGLDDPKRAVLDSVGLSVASEWWVGPT